MKIKVQSPAAQGVVGSQGVPRAGVYVGLIALRSTAHLLCGPQAGAALERIFHGYRLGWAALHHWAGVLQEKAQKTGARQLKCWDTWVEQASSGWQTWVGRAPPQAGVLVIRDTGGRERARVGRRQRLCAASAATAARGLVSGLDVPAPRLHRLPLAHNLPRHPPCQGRRRARRSPPARQSAAAAARAARGAGRRSCGPPAPPPLPPFCVLAAQTGTGVVRTRGRARGKAESCIRRQAGRRAWLGQGAKPRAPRESDGRAACKSGHGRQGVVHTAKHRCRLLEGSVPSAPPSTHPRRTERARAAAPGTLLPRAAAAPSDRPACGGHCSKTRRRETVAQPLSVKRCGVGQHGAPSGGEVATPVHQPACGRQCAAGCSSGGSTALRRRLLAFIQSSACCCRQRLRLCGLLPPPHLHSLASILLQAMPADVRIPASARTAARASAAMALPTRSSASQLAPAAEGGTLPGTAAAAEWVMLPPAAALPLLSPVAAAAAACAPPAASPAPAPAPAAAAAATRKSMGRCLLSCCSRVALVCTWPCQGGSAVPGATAARRRWAW